MPRADECPLAHRVKCRQFFVVQERIELLWRRLQQEDEDVTRAAEGERHIQNGYRVIYAAVRIDQPLVGSLHLFGRALGDDARGYDFAPQQSRSRRLPKASA